MSSAPQAAQVEGFAAQFQRPQGLAGRLCGHLMSVFNADMERAAVRRLALRGTEHVLAVGFGPGVGLAMLARRLPHGRVSGIDHSDVMVAQARRRCRRPIEDGRMDLRRGTVTALPWPAATFDAVCSVNNVHFWDPLDDAMREVARVLRPGGRLVIAVHRWAAQGPVGIDSHDTQPLAAALPAVLRAHGFADVEASEQLALSGRALSFVAART